MTAWAQAGIGSLGALGIVVGGLGLLPPRTRDGGVSAQLGIDRTAVVDRTGLADSLGAVVRHDPFRLDRRPAPMAFDPSRPDAEGPLEGPPAPPKPRLSITGMVGGPLPMALLEGVPGSEQPMLVGKGDTLGGLRIRDITRSSVMVSGYDTLWMLQVRDPW